MSSTSADLRRRFEDFERLPAAVLGDEIAGALSGRRLLIAGATGFVGSWLLAAIAWLNSRGTSPIHVVGVSRKRSSIDEPWFEALVGDVRTLGAPPSCDFLIHAAMSSEAQPSGGNDAIREIARSGTTWAIRAAENGTRTLLLSSGAVDNPVDAYANAKVAMERDAAAAAARGLPVAVARVYTCLGVGYRAHSHLAHVSLFDDAVRGGPLRLSGDGTAVRSYLYGADVAASLLRAVVLFTPGDVVVAGSQEPVLVRALAERIAAAAGLDSGSVEFGTAPPVPGRERYVAEPGESRTRLGLGTWTDLDTAIRRTLTLWPRDLA